jgi:hypothetical protein
MSNDHTVVTFNRPESKLMLIDLLNKQIRAIPHEYMSDCTAAIGLHYFPDSRLICLAERGGSEEHRVKLTYLTDR